MRIVLVGASGFLGRYLLYALTREGHRCVVLTRTPQRRSQARLLPGVELVQADVHDPAALAAQVRGADAVANMAGILNEAGHDGAGFHKVHVGITEAVIAACRETGVRRVLHVSALGAGEGESHYLKTKGEAEALLGAARDLHVSIFRPSVIFARGDDFFTRFAAMVKLLPLLPLACPGAHLQPVYAGDIAAAMTAALEDPNTWGKRFELGGPLCYTLKELVQWTARVTDQRCLVVGLPNWLSAAQAFVMEWVPGKPFSIDNYKSLQTDNTVRENGFAYFGIEPRGIEAVVPEYLRGSVRQCRLQSLRRRARR
ncbi:MAG: complex I NDUFA9 subunit family protein [Lysobacterales bacterium]|jgi:NADH dehydrogenase